MFGYMLQADCLEDAINRAARYYLRFHAEQHSFSLEQSDDSVHWRFHLGTPDDSATHTSSLADFSMGTLSWLAGLAGRMISLYLWHRLASWLIGNFIDLGAVRLDYPLQGNADDYILPFRAPVYFKQERCEMVLHRRYLKSPLIRDEADLKLMLETFPPPS